MGRPAIFLDRDGVLNVNRPDYVRSWDEFIFLPGTFGAMRALTALGAPIIVVTNQAGVGRRLIEQAAVEDIHLRMSEILLEQGARIERIYWCPHTIDDRCSCRKPEPGMLLAAAEQLDIDLQASVLVGDAVTDITAGQRAGCRTVLVMSGRGMAAIGDLARGGRTLAPPDAVATDLSAAVPIVERLLATARDDGAGQHRVSVAQHTTVSGDLAAIGGQGGEG